MLVFKSDSHRLMFHNMLKLQIKSSLLTRFGGLGQAECRILRSTGFRQFLSLWANSIINNAPKDSESHDSYVSSQIKRISAEILELPSVKELMDKDASVKWMVGRINGENDNVPKPYFPSVLRNPMIQFPFKHADIQKSRTLYGLLKFPFYRLSTSIYADSSESFKGLTDPQSGRDAGHLELRDQDASKDLDDSHPSHSQNSASLLGKPYGASNISHLKNRDNPKFCSNDYVYAPSELETGLKDR